jgi:hypothetical protein
VVFVSENTVARNGKYLITGILLIAGKGHIQQVADPAAAGKGHIQHVSKSDSKINRATKQISLIQVFSIAPLIFEIFCNG